MAHRSINNVFDVEGTGESYQHPHGYLESRRDSYLFRQNFTAASPQHGRRVYEVPLPTVSQRRRGSHGGTLRRQRMLADEQTAGENELTEEQMFNLLQKHNKGLVKNGTIRLPSDVLHRRKSRFDTDNFDTSQQGDEDEGNGQNGFEKLNITQLAMAAARTREESDPVKKTYRKLRSFYQETTLLKTTLNRIQGRYGAAIMEYFSFVKWLVLLNVVILILSLPMILPHFILEPYSYNDSIPELNSSLDLSCSQMQAKECSSNYSSIVHDSSHHPITQVHLYLLDFIQGTGVFEETPLFYGMYNRMKWNEHHYPMPIAFLVTTFLTLSISLVAILYSISTHMQSTVVAAGDTTTALNISVAVLSGWDHGLMGRSAVKVKKELIKQDLNRMLREEELKNLEQQRSRCQKYGLWIVRLVVNLIIIGILVGCGLAILQASVFAESHKNQFSEYLPTVVITAIYLVFPTFFNIIAKVEQYKPAWELGITMARILFLRLASLFLLLITTFTALDETVQRSNSSFIEEDCGHRTPLCGNPLFTNGTSSLHKCWETYVGQQVYRLIILDFIVLLATTYLVEYPRQAIYTRFEKTPFMAWLGQQEFDMPKNVMDVLYNQILCWIGIFFAPFVPLLITIKMVLFFLIKRGSLFANQRPSATLSKSSALSSFFYLVMWVSLVLAYLVLVVFMQFVSPSQSCGPFRIYLIDGDDQDYTMFDVIIKVLPNAAADIVFILENRLLQVAIILFLIVLWYLFITVSNGLVGETKLYVQQLTKSITDKQYLLAKVNQVIQETNDTTFSGPRPKTSADPINRQPDVRIAPQGEIVASEIEPNVYYNKHVRQQPEAKTRAAKQEFIQRKTRTVETVARPLSSYSSSSDSERYEAPVHVHRSNSRRTAKHEFIERKTRTVETVARPLSSYSSSSDSERYEAPVHVHRSNSRRMEHSAFHTPTVQPTRIPRKDKDNRLFRQFSDHYDNAETDPIDKRGFYQYQNPAFEPNPDY